MLRKHWNSVQKILPHVDHPALNAIVNSHGKTTAFPVTLKRHEETVLTATVNMLPSGINLSGAAIAVLLHKMKEQHMFPAWDHAVVGTSEHKHKAGMFLFRDEFAMEVDAYAGLSLKDAMERYHFSERHIAEYTGTPSEPHELLDAFCAAVIGSTATVQSADMERELYERRPKLLRLLPFRAKGLEF